MLQYREMASDELDASAVLAAEAFYGYEYFTVHFPDDARRRRLLDALIPCDFKASFGKPGVCFLTALMDGRLVAVAKLCEPGYEPPTADDYVRHGWPSVVAEGGAERVSAWSDMDASASAPCHELGEGNWYLGLLTVARADKGRGIGSAFMRDCLIPRARDAGGKCLSLFTNSEPNCRFYERCGLSLFDERRFEYEGRSLGSWSYRLKLG